MGISKDVIETEVKFTSDQAMADLTKLESNTATLRKENERLGVTKAKLAALGKQETEEYKKITAQMAENSKKVKENDGVMASLRRTIGLSALSMKDLRKRASELKGQLEGTSKAANPAEYKRLEKELALVHRQMDTLGTGTKKVGSIMRGLGELLPVASIAAAVAVVGAFAKELFNLTKQTQAEDRKAMIVLGDSMGYVEAQAEKLAKKIGITRHEFTSMVTNTADLLVPLDFTRKKAAEMAVQVQSLAGAMDEWSGGQYGVASASETLTKAMLGEKEELKKYGIAIREESEEFKNLVKQKKADGAATDEQAKAMATLELILYKSKDAQTSFLGEGNKLMRWQKSIALGWRQMKENIIGYFDTNPSEKIRKEKESVNALMFEYSDANTPLERRLEILDKLKTLAPDIVASLDAEGKATAITAEALRDYNRNMIDRIILSEKQLEYEAKAKKQAKATELREKAEKDLRGIVDSRIESIKDEQKQKEALQIMLNGEMTLLEKINELKKTGLLIDAISPANTPGSGTNMRFSSMQQDPLMETINNFNRLIEVEREQKWTVNDLFKDLQDKKAAMGMLMSGPWSPGFDPNDIPGGGGKGKTDKEIEKQYKADLDLVKGYLIERQNILLESYKEGVITQEEYAAELMTMEFDTLESRLRLSKKYNIDVAETGKELLDQHIKIKENQAELVDQIAKDLVKSLEESDKDAAAAFAKLLEKNATDFFDKEEMFEPNKTGDQKIMNWASGTEEGELAALKNKLDNKEILESEYQENRNKIEQKYQDIKLQRLQAYGDAAKSVLDMVGSFQEAAMNRELAAAGDNTKKREEIEKKFNEKRKKWAIAQTIIEGIIEVAKIWKASADWGPAGPAIAIAQTVAAVARTAGQIAILASQKFDKGGFTGSGPWDQPQGVVHSDEFVASRYAVRNKSVRPFLDVIDLAQRSGQISSLNTDTILRAVEARRGGYAFGGFAPPAPSSSPTVYGSDPELKAIIAENSQAMFEMRAQLALGFKGDIVLTEFERKQNELNAIRAKTTMS